MKYTFACLLALLSFNINAQIVSQGLQAFYQFNDEFFTDNSGNGINGTGFNVTQTDGLEQRQNTAYNFNGTNSYIVAGNDNRQVTDQVTLSVWFKSTSTEIQNICAKYDWNIDRGYFIRMIDGKATLGGRNNGDAFVEIQGLRSINDGKWHLLTGMVNGNNWKFFIDCKIQGETNSNSSNPSLDTDVPLSIGRLSIPTGSNDYRYFNGDIDDVRLYNRILTDLEQDSLCGQNFLTNINNVENSYIDFSLSPNPTTDLIKVNLELNSTYEKLFYRIFNAMGTSIQNGQLVGSEISLYNLTSGVYHVQLLSEDNEILGLEKVIKY